MAVIANLSRTIDKRTLHSDPQPLQRVVQR